MRSWLPRVATAVAVLSLVVMGVTVVRWQQAESAADDAERAAIAAEERTAAARIEALETLLDPGSVDAFLDVYERLFRAVCTDQQSPIDAMIEEEVAEASEAGEPLHEHPGWELAFHPSAVEAARDGCTPG